MTGRFSTLDGKPRGFVSGAGYVYLRIDGKTHLAHRVAWLHVFGHWPVQQVDHQNGDRLDNRIANLRDVAPAINNENRVRPQSNNLASGKRGVSWHAHSRGWRARITVQGVEHRLGTYPSIDEAYAVYVAAKQRLHQGFTPLNSTTQ